MVFRREILSRYKGIIQFGMFWLLVALAVACSTSNGPGASEDGQLGQVPENGVLALPELGGASAQVGTIRILATTGLIGDVTMAVAGEDAQVTVLMAPNQDPHGYQSTAADLRLAAASDAILVNGWRLEEGLLDDLENAAGDTPIVPISAGIVPRSFGASAIGDAGRGSDPHVWLSPLNVIEWTDNIEFVLSTLDPANAESYAERAQEYRSQLRDLDAHIRQQLAQLDESKRVLVTNHDAFGYFADAYGFKIIGTIIPGDSSLAEPASRDLAILVERMREASVCAMFAEYSANQRLATQLIADLDHCDDVQIVTLYSGALGDDGSGAQSYLAMMRTNVDLIVGALR